MVPFKVICSLFLAPSRQTLSPETAIVWTSASFLLWKAPPPLLNLANINLVLFRVAVITSSDSEGDDLETEGSAT